MQVLSLSAARALFVARRDVLRASLDSSGRGAVTHHKTESRVVVNGVTSVYNYYRPDYDRDVRIVR